MQTQCGIPPAGHGPSTLTPNLGTPLVDPFDLLRRALERDDTRRETEIIAAHLARATGVGSAVRT